MFTVYPVLRKSIHSNSMVTLLTLLNEHSTLWKHPQCVLSGVGVVFGVGVGTGSCVSVFLIASVNKRYKTVSERTYT